MKHIYKIEGMTCNGCRGHVEDILSKVKGVSKASVDLEKAAATIEMETHISLETFQEALKKDGDRYSIHNVDDQKPIQKETPSSAEIGMKHSYHIHGMTCNGCRGHVEETLSKVKGVLKAAVDLEKAVATIEMESHISLEVFQEALKKDGDRYSIHKSGEHPHISKKEEKPKGKGTGVFYCPMHCEDDKTYEFKHQNNGLAQCIQKL